VSEVIFFVYKVSIAWLTRLIWTLEFVSSELEIGTPYVSYVFLSCSKSRYWTVTEFVNAVTVHTVLIKNDNWVGYAVALTGLYVYWLNRMVERRNNLISYKNDLMHIRIEVIAIIRLYSQDCAPATS
jgi:hypothetical protein